MALPMKKKLDDKKKSSELTSSEVDGAAKALANKKGLDKNKKKKAAAKLKNMLDKKK